jgi:hypothetical protein
MKHAELTMDTQGAEPVARRKAIRLWTTAGLLLLIPLVLGPYLGGVLVRRLADAGAADG